MLSTVAISEIPKIELLKIFAKENSDHFFLLLLTMKEFQIFSVLSSCVPKFRTHGSGTQKIYT